VFSVGKTGTITMNPLAVTNVISLDHSTQTGVLSTEALVSQEANQDPIELAFLAAARERHIFDVVPAVTAISVKPFDPQSRRTILKAIY
jgi:H+-transporting ATPase